MVSFPLLPPGNLILGVSEFFRTLRSARHETEEVVAKVAQARASVVSAALCHSGQPGIWDQAICVPTAWPHHLVTTLGSYPACPSGC